MKVGYADSMDSEPTFIEHLDTVEEFVPVYAPKNDGHDPQAYIKAIRKLVERWQAEEGSA